MSQLSLARFRSRPFLLLSLMVVAVIGVGAALVALGRADDDPITALLSRWPIVAAAGIVYALGMCVYAVSWAALFEPEDNRRLIALSFLISQPVKYLPGGVAQPISQIALAAQASRSGSRAVIVFPVHVLVNVVAALTLSSPLLFLADIPRSVKWLIVLIPLLWTTLDRRWMTRVMAMLARVHHRFQAAGDLPDQRSINFAFLAALLAHGAMFWAFGILASSPAQGWTSLSLAFAYGFAWLVGYVAVPAPAGLGAREGMLAALLAGSASTLDIVRLSAVHRILTLVVELALLVVAIVATKLALSGLDHDHLKRSSSDAVTSDSSAGPSDTR